MLWPHRKIVLHVEDNSVENNERSKDERKADWGLDIHLRRQKAEKDREEVLQHHSRLRLTELAYY